MGLRKFICFEQYLSAARENLVRKELFHTATQLSEAYPHLFPNRMAVYNYVKRHPKGVTRSHKKKNSRLSGVKVYKITLDGALVEPTCGALLKDRDRRAQWRTDKKNKALNKKTMKAASWKVAQAAAEGGYGDLQVGDTMNGTVTRVTQEGIVFVRWHDGRWLQGEERMGTNRIRLVARA